MGHRQVCDGVHRKADLKSEASEGAGDVAIEGGTGGGAEDVDEAGAKVHPVKEKIYQVLCACSLLLTTFWSRKLKSCWVLLPHCFLMCKFLKKGMSGRTVVMMKRMYPLFLSLGVCVSCRGCIICLCTYVCYASIRPLVSDSPILCLSVN